MCIFESSVLGILASLNIVSWHRQLILKKKRHCQFPSRCRMLSTIWFSRWLFLNKILEAVNPNFNCLILYVWWCVPGGGGTRSENWWGCAAGRWKLDPKRSREKWNLGPKRSNSLRIGSFNTPKDRFGVGGWEKIPQKDRARSCQSEKRGSKPRHICITHHIGSTPPGVCLTL